MARRACRLQSYRAHGYLAWGDGLTDNDVRSRADGGPSVWYSTDEVVVGVLTHEAETCRPAR